MEKEIKLRLLDNFLNQTCGLMVDVDREMLGKIFELTDEDVDNAVGRYWQEMKKIDNEIDQFIDKLQELFKNGFTAEEISLKTGLLCDQIEKLRHHAKDRDRLRNGLNKLYSNEEELFWVVERANFMMFDE